MARNRKTEASQKPIEKGDMTIEKGDRFILWRAFSMKEREMRKDK